MSDIHGNSRLPDSGLASEILAQQPAASSGTDLLRLADELSRQDDALVAGRSAAPQELHLVTFKVGDEEYGVTIDRVREILRLRDITRLPGAPPHLRGVTNVRGRIVPVVDMHHRLGLQPREATVHTRVLLVDLRGRVIGLLVDAVAQVLKVPISQVSETSDDTTSHAEHILGVARLEHLVILLDLDHLLLPAATTPRHA